MNNEIVRDDNMNEQVTRKEIKEPSELNGKFTFYLFYCSIISVIGGTFHFGWNVSVLNIPIQYIENFINQTYYERNKIGIPEDELELLIAVVNGAVPLGGIFGGAISGLLADKLGRKKAMILSNIVVILSGVLSVISKFVNSYECLIVGRLFSGIESGILTGICSIYLTEIAPQNLRGLAGTISPLALTSGIFLASIFGLPQILGTDDRWPYLLAIKFIPVVLHMGLFFAVESPKYLYVNKKNKQEAKKVLLRLRGEHQRDLVEKEIIELENELKNEDTKSESIGYIGLLKTKHLRRALFVALFLQIAQQLIGADAMIFYSTKIFKQAELGDEWSNYGTLILSFLQVFMTVICMFTIEKFGRRTLLIGGTIGVSFSCLLLAIFRILIEYNPVKWYSYITIVAAVLFTISFNIGPGSVAFMITNELFDSDLRGKVTNMTSSLNWICIFILATFYPFIEGASWNSYGFLIFAVDSIIFAVLIYIFLPETKDKSYAEIETHFKTSIIYRPKFKSSNKIRDENNKNDDIELDVVRF